MYSHAQGSSRAQYGVHKARSLPLPNLLLLLLRLSSQWRAAHTTIQCLFADACANSDFVCDAPVTLDNDTSECALQCHSILPTSTCTYYQCLPRLILWADAISYARFSALSFCVWTCYAPLMQLLALLCALGLNYNA